MNDNEREKRNAHGREDMAKLKEKTTPGKPQDCPKDLAEHLEVLIRTCLELLCNYKEENLGFEQKLNFTGTSSLPGCSQKSSQCDQHENITQSRNTSCSPGNTPLGIHPKHTRTDPGDLWRERGEGRIYKLQLKKQIFHLELQASGNSAISVKRNNNGDE